MDPLITKDMPERRTAMHLREGRGSNQREEDIAIIGMLTGNKNITGPSAIMSQQVNQKQIQNTRQNAIRDQQDQTADYQDRALKQTMDIAKMENQGRQDVANAAMQLRNDDKINADVKALGTAMEKSGMIGLRNAVDLLNLAVAEHKGKDIPGVGGAFGLSNTFLGKRTAGGRKVQQAFANYKNMLLKARSGGAVTPEEYERLTGELGIGLMNTDEDFLRAVAFINKTETDRLDNFGQTYRPEAVQIYLSRGGRLSLESIGEAPAPPGAGGLSPAEQAELAELELEFGG